nr:hypothetical protein [Tanacetum cinerariifolium]GFD46083.1 hypothetical protein [Tanacetum cinerariifolium]
DEGGGGVTFASAAGGGGWKSAGATPEHGRKKIEYKMGARIKMK